MPERGLDEAFWREAGLNVHLFEVSWWTVWLYMAALPFVLAWIVVTGAWDSCRRALRR